MISIIFVILFGLISEQQEADSLELRRLDKDGAIELVFVNKNVFPVSVELEVDVVNLKSSKRLPLNDVIRAKNQKNVIRLEVDNLNEPWSYRTNYKWYMGSYFARHDDRVLYRLPFRKGTSHRLDQGYDGKFSHQGDSKYSLDFHMEEGTPIHAARSGLVIDVIEAFKSGGSEEGYKSMANNITILHDDGTMADYSHLQFNGAIVEVGDKVVASQIIGYSGATGYVTGPHLHFRVKKTVKGGGFESIPVRFTTQEGILENLVVGKEYLGY